MYHSRIQFTSTPLLISASSRDQAAILDESLPDTMSLFDLASDTPLSWEEQRGRVENNALGGQLQVTRHCRLTAFAGNHPGEFVNRQR